MHLATALAFLAATVAAIPTEEPQQGEMNFIVVWKPATRPIFEESSWSFFC